MDETSVEYWKSKYEDQVEQYRALASTSKEVETELEEYVRMLEDQVEKMKSESKQSVTDLEKLRQRYSEIQKENNDLINIRDHQEAKLSDLSTRVRDLENQNDTLMQSERRANFKIELLQEELESHLLKLCSLEEEVIQKDQLSEALQRVKDEARDLRQEIKVQELKAAAAVQTPQDQPASKTGVPSTNGSQISGTGAVVNTNGVSSNTNTTASQQNNAQFHSRTNTNSNIDSAPTQLPPTAKVHPMKKSIYQTQSLAHTPSSRSNALVIVSDLLRKVSNMESKIASCRTYSSAQMHPSVGPTPIAEYVQSSNNTVNAPLRSTEHDETMAI